MLVLSRSIVVVNCHLWLNSLPKSGLIMHADCCVLVLKCAGHEQNHSSGGV